MSKSIFTSYWNLALVRERNTRKKQIAALNEKKTKTKSKKKNRTRHFFDVRIYYLLRESLWNVIMEYDAW